MKALLLLSILATTALAAFAGPPSLAQTVRAAKWQKRVLLLGAPTANTPGLQQQKHLLASVPDQLRARDLQIIEVIYDQLTPADRQYLQESLSLKLTGFEVVLIGKDGGVKQTSPHPLPPTALFATIDQMPMRRQEMQRRSH